MEAVKHCTALVAPGSRCGATAARVFVSAFYPDGPELRLCGAHERRYYAACIEACRRGNEDALGRIASDWRFAGRRDWADRGRGPA